MGRQALGARSAARNLAVRPAHAEGLGDVVVGAQVQPVHLVLLVTRAVRSLARRVAAKGAQKVGPSIPGIMTSRMTGQVPRPAQGGAACPSAAVRTA
jgi:hypothetical protein